MATITKLSLANSLTERFGLSVNDAYKMVNIIFDEIELALIHGENVKITGLGSFNILDKKTRLGRNPKTGDIAIISARRVVSFRPNTEFKKALN